MNSVNRGSATSEQGEKIILQPNAEEQWQIRCPEPITHPFTPNSKPDTYHGDYGADS